MINSDIRDQAYRFFIEEAAELLQIIETTLINLRQDGSNAKIHEMMRAAHSIKGGAASLELDTIKAIAHRLEDYFKALYLDVEIDEELENLLLQGFDCLKDPLTEQIAQGQFDEVAAREKAQPIFAALDLRLGEALQQSENYVPSSADLGVDLTASLFEIDVTQRLEVIASLLENGTEQELNDQIQATIELFEGFAQISNLANFGAIGQVVQQALAARPDDLHRIGQLALSNWQQAQTKILAGELTGDFVSQELRNLINVADDFALYTELRSEDALLRPPALEELGSVFELDDVFGSYTDNNEPEEIITEVPSLDEVFFAPDLLPQVTETFEAIAQEPETVNDELSSLTEILEAIAQDFEPLPSLEPVNDELSSLSETIDAIAQDFEQLPTVEELPQLPVLTPTPDPVQPKLKTETTPTPTALSVRVDFNRLERMNNLVGELAINRNSLSLQNEQLQGAVKELLNRFARFSQITEKLRDVSDQMLIDASRYGSWSGSERGFLKEEKSDFDALEMDRYGNLYSSIQGLLEEMIQLEESVDDIVLYARGSNQTLETQRQMVTQLRDELMWARMLPLGEVLNRFPRVLRDLSTRYQKPVRLKLMGTGVLVDKVALEKLYDPLLHLLRNAFDHGIEATEIRQKHSKNPEGLIEIRAYHQGNQTMIEVRDDGGGLNYEKIKEQAVLRGLISAEQVASLSKDKIANLIFEPGFSTAEQVSELSGRGVGLDVVRSQLQALKGNVTVTSSAGQGTIFTLRLPLTLTVAKLLVCLIHPNDTRNLTTTIAIPSDSIEEIIVPQGDQIKHAGQQRFLQFAGQLIPIYKLGELFEYRCQLNESNLSKSLTIAVPSPEDWGLPLLVLRRGQQLYALEVSRLLSEQELVIKPFGSAIAAPRYTYGCTILGDGTLLPVVNAVILLEQFLDFNPDLPRTEVKTPVLIPHSVQTPTILVVDDSAALRKTLALTLEKSGYRVLQARDGREAIEQLQHNTGINLVICDVEMPNMNGFEFLGQRRRDQDLNKIPVAMLTSRSSEKHRQLAMQLGASEYFTKPYIEQQFLTSIKNLIAQSVEEPQLIPN